MAINNDPVSKALERYHAVIKNETTGDAIHDTFLCSAIHMVAVADALTLLHETHLPRPTHIESRVWALERISNWISEQRLALEKTDHAN